METLEGYDSVLKKNQPDDMDWETTAGAEWQEGEADGPALLCVQVLRRRNRGRCKHGGHRLPLLRQSRGDDGPVFGRSQAGSCHSVQAG